MSNLFTSPNSYFNHESTAISNIMMQKKRRKGNLFDLVCVAQKILSIYSDFLWPRPISKSSGRLQPFLSTTTRVHNNNKKYQMAARKFCLSGNFGTCQALHSTSSSVPSLPEPILWLARWSIFLQSGRSLPLVHFEYLI